MLYIYTQIHTYMTYVKYLFFPSAIYMLYICLFFSVERFYD